MRIRLFVYKVGHSSRNRPNERRVEITTTYQKNLKPAHGFRDVVLGLEPASGVLVGVDPHRLHHGGATGNASTFVDEDAIARASSSQILMATRPATIFAGGVEHQAYFRPARLAEYIFNIEAIHAGTYLGFGSFSGAVPRAPKGIAARSGPHFVLAAYPSTRRMPRLRASAVAALEADDYRRLSRLRLGAAEFQQLRRRMEEDGAIGEQLVYAREITLLLAAGQRKLAAKVKRISQDDVGAGYDVLSFEPSGKPKLIEVKSTEGNGKEFPMSLNEWNVANRARDKYWIARVTFVRSAKPAIVDVNDPVAAEAAGKLTRDAGGWLVTLR